jgi:hypothetical protein
MRSFTPIATGSLGVININTGERPDPRKLPALMPRVHSFDETFDDAKRHLRVFGSRITYSRFASRDITTPLRFSRANGDIIANLTSLIKVNLGDLSITISFV